MLHSFFWVIAICMNSDAGESPKRMNTIAVKDYLQTWYHIPEDCNLQFIAILYK